MQELNQDCYRGCHFLPSFLRDFPQTIIYGGGVRRHFNKNLMGRGIFPKTAIQSLWNKKKLIPLILELITTKAEIIFNNEDINVYIK